MAIRFFVIFVLVLILSFMVGGAFSSAVKDAVDERPVPAEDWDDSAKLWAARSVVGEVGFIRKSRPGEIEDEYVSVLSVYAKRLREIRASRPTDGWTFERVVRKYSAAVKSFTRRRWLIQMDLDGSKPKSWPNDHGKWKSVHMPLWLDALDVVDRWARGEISTKTPTANHYGGAMDAYYAEKVLKWKRVKAPKYFGNRFYNSRILTGKPLYSNIMISRYERFMSKR